MKYRITAVLSTLVVVADGIEADSESAALEWAENNYDPPDVCHQCGVDKGFENDFGVERFWALLMEEDDEAQAGQEDQA